MVSSSTVLLRSPAVHASPSDVNNFVPALNGAYTVGDFMTGRQHLPVIDDDWNLVGVVSDYDLLALDSISVTACFNSIQFVLVFVFSL
ncbi:unnamed protein product [Brassica rapa subsp. narinosa]